MRTILLGITALVSLSITALGYLALSHQIALSVYVLFSLIISIALTFLCGHLAYHYYLLKHPKP